MKMHWALALAGVALIGGASSANAAVTFNATSVTAVHGNAPTGKLNYAPTNYHTGTALITPETLSGTVNGLPVSFMGYCIDIFQYSGPTNFDVVSLSSFLNNATRYDEIAALISAQGNGGVAGTTLHDAAVQLAVWELAFESTSTLDVTSGGFSVSSLSNANAATGANSYLTAASSSAAYIDPLLNLYVAKSATKQDFLVWTYSTPSVPEPASWAMMILGLGAVGATLRNSRRQTAVRFA